MIQHVPFGRLAGGALDGLYVAEFDCDSAQLGGSRIAVIFNQTNDDERYGSFTLSPGAMAIEIQVGSSKRSRARFLVFPDRFQEPYVAGISEQVRPELGFNLLVYSRQLPNSGKPILFGITVTKEKDGSHKAVFNFTGGDPAWVIRMLFGRVEGEPFDWLETQKGEIARLLQRAGLKWLITGIGVTGIPLLLFLLVRSLLV